MTRSCSACESGIIDICSCEFCTLLKTLSSENQLSTSELEHTKKLFLTIENDIKDDDDQYHDGSCNYCWAAIIDCCSCKLQKTLRKRMTLLNRQISWNEFIVLRRNTCV